MVRTALDAQEGEVCRQGWRKAQVGPERDVGIAPAETVPVIGHVAAPHALVAQAVAVVSRVDAQLQDVTLAVQAVGDACVQVVKGIVESVLLAIVAVSAVYNCQGGTE